MSNNVKFNLVGGGELNIPARFISKEEQRNIFDSFINAEFQGGRHTRRVDKKGQIFRKFTR